MVFTQKIASNLCGRWLHFSFILCKFRHTSEEKLRELQHWTLPCVEKNSDHHSNSRDEDKNIESPTHIRPFDLIFFILLAKFKMVSMCNTYRGAEVWEQICPRNGTWSTSSKQTRRLHFNQMVFWNTQFCWQTRRWHITLLTRQSCYKSCVFLLFWWVSIWFGTTWMLRFGNQTWRIKWGWSTPNWRGGKKKNNLVLTPSWLTAVLFCSSSLGSFHHMTFQFHISTAKVYTGQRTDVARSSPPQQYQL